MHQVSADHELLASQLQQQLLTAQGISKEKQQKLELLSLITRASKDDTAKLCATHSSKQPTPAGA